MSKRDKKNLLVWGAWGLLFVLNEIPAANKKVPWDTLSTATWRLQKRYPTSSIFIKGGLAILEEHIVRSHGLWAGDGL